jgi:hypothetical protein
MLDNSLLQTMRVFLDRLTNGHSPVQAAVHANGRIDDHAVTARRLPDRVESEQSGAEFPSERGRARCEFSIDA